MLECGQQQTHSHTTTIISTNQDQVKSTKRLEWWHFYFGWFLIAKWQSRKVRDLERERELSTSASLVFISDMEKKFQNPTKHGHLLTSRNALRFSLISFVVVQQSKSNVQLSIELFFVEQQTKSCA